MRVDEEMLVEDFIEPVLQTGLAKCVPAFRETFDGGRVRMLWHGRNTGKGLHEW